LSSGLTGERVAFDWERAYTSLDETRRALEELDDQSGPTARRILERRARELARRASEPEALREPVDIVVFDRGAERYAVRADAVQGVVPLRELTRVPWTPRCILGVVSHRGRVLPVIDLRELPMPTGQSTTEPAPGLLLAVEASGIAFGLASDEVAGTRTIGAETVGPAPGGPETFVRGVLDDMVSLLDVEAIARSPRITVNDEVS
jgi:purine-binding chemotaxis protein CheW